MSRRILAVFAVAVLSGSFLLGCSGEKGENGNEQTQNLPLVDTFWELAELKGEPAVHPESEKIHIRLRGDEPRIGGFSGCNRFMGNYELDGEALRFGELASTMMACPNLDEEQIFLRAMAEVTKFEISGESLEFQSDSGSIARFTAMYQEE